MAPPASDRRDLDPAPSWRGAVQPLFLLVLVFFATRFCIALPNGAQRIAPVWLPSAIMLAALLRSGGRRWALLAAAGAVGQFLAGLSVGFGAVGLAPRVVASVAESGLAALWVRRLIGPGLDLERPRHFMVLCGVCVTSAFFAGGLQSLGLWLATGEAPLHSLRAWCLSHPLCLMVLTPCLMVLGRPRLHLGAGGLTTRAALALGAMLATALLVFAQSRFPLMFLALPVLTAVSLEAGLYGAAMAVMVLASVALPATIAGLGPVALSHGDVAEKAAVLQLFLAVSLFTSLPVAALKARWRNAEAQARGEAHRAQRAEALAVASEARHRALTDQAPDAIGTMNMAGELTFVSPAVEAITGYTPEELTGSSLAEFISPEDLPRVQANLRRLTLGDEDDGAKTIEYRLRRKDGTWVWLQANPRLVRDAGGEPVGTVDVVRDVTARKHMELKLAAALEASLAGVRAKSEFLANMSHELRTPLTGILGYAEVMQADPALPEASRRHAERIGAAGSMLLALVNDVLDLSRAEAGGLALHPRSTDLGRLVHDAVDMIRPQAQRAALALSVEAGGCGPSVMVDADRVRQVVVNLLGNAVKFTSRGVVTVSLRCEPAADDELDVRISVADTGMGIPADRLPHIFDRFEQADGSISRSFGGAGLGLAISRTLVRAMGGEISAESTLGAGSVFTARLRLPVARPSAASDPGAGAREPVVSRRTTAGLRVLLAEDVAVNRDLITLMLSPLDVRLEAVADGAAAVQAASVQAFDVILMDMQMPVMDGLEATRRIRADGGPSAAARIVALTANVLPEEVERCLAAGMDDHLSKPLSAADLAAQLHVGRTPGRLARAA